MVFGLFWAFFFLLFILFYFLKKCFVFYMKKIALGLYIYYEHSILDRSYNNLF
jgi:hypothetical protein